MKKKCKGCISYVHGNCIENECLSEVNIDLDVRMILSHALFSQRISRKAFNIAVEETVKYIQKVKK